MMKKDSGNFLMLSGLMNWKIAGTKIKIIHKCAISVN